MSAAPIPVLVTGAGGGGHGEQIVKALRQGTLDYHIITSDITDDSTARVTGDEFRRLPRANDPHYLDAIWSVVHDTKVRAVFHGSEPEMAVFSQHREQFHRKGIYLPVNPPEVLSVCQDKGKTCNFLNRQGFVVPTYREIASVEDTLDFDEFPAVLKPAVGGGGSANVYIVQDADELASMAKYCLRFCDLLTLQAYVGTPDREFTVGVLFGADGTLIDSIVVRRLIGNALTVRSRVPNRTGRSELGSELIISSGISQGEVGHWPEIASRCEAAAKALSPRAPVNIQCRYVEGEVIIFEINPRFSGTTSLRAMCGYNEPDVLIRRDVLGESMGRSTIRPNLILRSLHEHIIPPLDEARNGVGRGSASQ